MMEIKQEDLDRIRALAQKATPGPWRKPTPNGYVLCIKCKPENYRFNNDVRPPRYSVAWTDFQNEEDAAYIAAANPAFVLALVDEVERLRAGNARLEKEADWLAQYCEGQDQCPYLALNWEYNPPDWCQCTDTIEEGFDCYMNPIECWREAARKAVEEQSEQSKPDLFDRLAEHPDTKLAPEEPCKSKSN